MISLEGNVGVGKSTVLRELQRRGIRVQPEAVDHWTLLESFYHNPRRFGFGFQLQVLVSYCATPMNTQIVERSSEAALQVFVPLAEANGHIRADEAHELRRMAAMLPVPDIRRFVFLVADPALCLRRIAWRNREGEERITLEYLRQLDDAYARFMGGIPDNQKVIVAVHEDDTPSMLADRIVNALGI